MRIKFRLLGAILFIFRCCYAQSPASELQIRPATNSTSSVKLDDSTPIVLCTKQQLSSATLRVGERVAFRVVKDVKVADLIVIRRGADAWGLITAVEPKRRKGRPGSLDIAIHSVQLLTGENASLRAEEHSEGKGREVDPIAELPRTGVQTFGVGIPIELFLMLAKGQDADWPAGSRVTAYLNGDVVLDRSALERVQPIPMSRSSAATVTIFRTDEIRIFRTAKNPALSPQIIYCGKVALAKLPRSAYLKIQLPAGNYVFRSSFGPSVAVHLEEGKEFYLQMQLVISKDDLENALVQVDPEVGEEKITNLHQLADKEVATVSDSSLPELQATPETK